MANKITSPHTPASLPARLLSIRNHYGISRPVFADVLGIPQTTLKNYELGYREIDVNVMYRFVRLVTTKPEVFQALYDWLFLDQPGDFDLSSLKPDLGVKIKTYRKVLMAGAE